MEDLTIMGILALIVGVIGLGVLFAGRNKSKKLK